VTKSVLNAERKQEKDIYEAIAGRNMKEGEKVWLYRYEKGYEQIIKDGKPQIYKRTGEPKKELVTGLKMMEDFDGHYYKIGMVKRVYNTLMIFEKLIDHNKCIDYSKKSNKKYLEGLLGYEL
jgi:hypothetical protein